MTLTMNSFEQAGTGEISATPEAEIDIALLKQILSEWLSAGGDTEETIRRLQRVEEWRRGLESRYPDCRRYKAFFLLTPGEVEAEGTTMLDFPGADSVALFINNL